MSPALVAPAGAWRRYAAWSLDFSLLGGVATGLSWPRLVAAAHATGAAWERLSALLGQALAGSLLQPPSPAALAGSLLSNPDVQAAAAGVQHGIEQLLLAWLVCYALLAAPYHIGFERSHWQGSPGKRALRLRVVDARDDQPAATWRLVSRHLAGALSWLTFNLGHALAALPPRKRALHDWLSGTQVLSEAGAAPLPAWTRAWLALQFVTSIALLAWCLHRYAELMQASLS